MTELEAHNERCFTRLRSLAQEVPIGVIGSAALLLLHAEARGRYRLPDLDVVLREDDVAAFDRWVRNQGGHTRVWDVPLTPETSLDGKFYARAIVDDVQLDATFEVTLESVEVFLGSVTLVDGVPVCSERLVQRLKRRARPEAFRAFLEATGIADRS